METMDDGVIPTGYGETIIKKGKDTIALNNSDQMAIVAGTNLGGSSQSAPVQDNTETKRTNMLLEKLISQPSVFKIGTDEFYTATSKYSYQVQLDLHFFLQLFAKMLKFMFPKIGRKIMLTS